MNFNEIFNDSYERNCHNDLFYICFYDIFIKKHEAIAAQFEHTNMTQQNNMLEASLVFMVNFSANKIANDYLCELARMHQKLNIPSEWYNHWLDALVETLEQSDPLYKPHDGLAWRVILSPGISFMQQHHRYCSDHCNRCQSLKSP